MKKTYLKKTEGSVIRRAKYTGWLRNIAVALGNAPKSIKNHNSFYGRGLSYPNEIVAEHVKWALTEQQKENR